MNYGDWVSDEDEVRPRSRKRKRGTTLLDQLDGDEDDVIGTASKSHKSRKKISQGGRQREVQEIDSDASSEVRQVSVISSSSSRASRPRGKAPPSASADNLLLGLGHPGQQRKKARAHEEEGSGSDSESGSGSDYSDSDSDEEQVDETKRQFLKNEVLVVDPSESNQAFHAMHGDSEDVEEFDSRLASYGKDEWKRLAESLFRSNLDTNCSDRDLLMTFRVFYQIFCYPYKNEYDVVDRIRAIYPHVTNMKDQFKKIVTLFGLIHFELIKRRMVDEKTRHGREIQRMLTMISFGMKMSFEGLVMNRLLQKGTDKSMRAMLEEMTPLTFFKEIDPSKLKKHQQLLHFYYREAFKNNYRKDGECLYKPRYNKYDEFVYAYEYVCDISDFVFNSLFPLEQNHYWFECLTERNNNSKMCINILTNVKSEWLRDLERNPNIHSFQNGLFVLSLNTFFYFKKTPGKQWVGNLSGNLTAIKYHDIIFDEEGMSRDMNDHRCKTYMSIKMDAIHQVFATQKFSMEERRWIFALLGRMLHPLGSMDTWGVFPYFLGLAGTGKSTSLRLVASLLEARDVGYLNNTLQKTFALEGIFDKLIYLALDIDESFQLDQATFQSMVVGEEVAVLRKYKRPLTVLWNIHGGFAGNKLPNWTDNGGSLSRRLVVIEFLQPVTRCDPNLFEKCLRMKDRFIKVINSAYHDLSRKYKDRGIKEVIPAKFKKSEAQALLELNVLMAFIKDCADLDPDKKNKTYIQSFKDFSKAFKVYCQRNSIRPKPLNYNFYNGVFAKFQLKVIKPQNPAKDPFGQASAYILGVKLKDSALEDDNE